VLAVFGPERESILPDAAAWLALLRKKLSRNLRRGTGFFRKLRFTVDSLPSREVSKV
jgi:hypothetical protein